MNFEISITIDLTEYDDALSKYCADNQYDVPDYTTMQERIEGDLCRIAGADKVIFNHMCWIKVDLGTDNFIEASVETQKVMREIEQVFQKHGIVL